MNNVVKNLIMFIVSTIAGLVVTNGIPDTQPELILFAVIAIGSTFGYMGKNFIFPSVSVLGVFDLRDVISAIFVAIAAGFSDYVGVLLSGLEFTWTGLIKAVVTVIAGYFVKTKYLQGQPK